MSSLSTGKHTISGHTVDVLEVLGSGTQGDVYKVNVDGQTYALKWYHTRNDDQSQRDRLRRLSQRPAPSDRFLWPKVYLEDNGRFGYLMDLCPSSFKGIHYLLGGKAQISFRNLVRMCLQLVTEFRSLHNAGLCYGDVSHNNIFFRPDTGDIRIIDNDNVVVDGSEDFGVLGTPKYMAPEIVRGDALPGTDTDAFSLAVLIYYTLVLEHPLHGRREYNIHAMDGPAMDQLYGYDPVFMFDPDDDSNRPVSGYHDNAELYWDIYPDYLRDAFIKTFTEGLDNPSDRLTDFGWQKVLTRLHDNVIRCPQCDSQNFYDLTYLKNHEGQMGTCWHDDTQLHTPPRMRFSDSHVIVLTRDTKLYNFHVEEQLSASDHRFRFDHPVAEVTKHPTKNIWGLKNLSSSDWRIERRNGDSTVVPQGRSVSFSNGMTIDFGQRRAQIRG